MLKKFPLISSLLLTVIVLISGCSKPDPKVAVIGDFSTISLSDLKYGLIGNHPDFLISQYSLAAAKFRLNRMINDEIIFHDAVENGWNKNEAVLERFEKGYQKILLTYLYNHEIFKKIITESAIKDYYNHMDRYVVCKNIFFRFPAYANKSQRDSVKAIADDVYSQLKKGGDYTKLVQQYSNDEVSAKKQGLIGKLTWNRGNDPLLQAAFSLRVGEVSRPVMNRMGYSLVKALEIVKTDTRKPYAQVRQTIVSTLAREKKKELDAAAVAYWDKVKDSFNLNFNDSLLTLWTEKITSFGQTASKVLKGFSSLDEKTMKTVLGTYSFGTVTPEIIRENLQLMQRHTRFYLADAKNLQSFLLKSLQPSFLQKYALAKKIDHLPEVIKEKEQLKKNIIIDAFSQKVIIGNTDFTAADIKNYFEKNKSEKYAEPEKRTVYEILINSADKAEMTYNKINSGKSFEQAALELTERRGYKRRKGLLGNIKKNQWGPIGKQAFSMQPGEVSRPITLDDNKGYSLIKVTKIIPRKILKFEDLQNKVHSDMKLETVRNRKSQWLAAQKAKHSVRINDEALQDVFK